MYAISNENQGFTNLTSVGDINGYCFIQKEIRSNKLPDPFIRYIS